MVRNWVVKYQQGGYGQMSTPVTALLPVHAATHHALPDDVDALRAWPDPASIASATPLESAAARPVRHSGLRLA